MEEYTALFRIELLLLGYFIDIYQLLRDAEPTKSIRDSLTLQHGQQ
jgi:hypothetical protein